MREWNTGWGGGLGGAEPVALVVDADARSRAELAEDMRVLGIGVVEASSPLEAIDVLDRWQAQVGSVVIAPTIRSASQAELARFIAEMYPALHQVLVRGPHWHRGKADHRWLLFDLQGELVELPGGPLDCAAGRGDAGAARAEGRLTVERVEAGGRAASGPRRRMAQGSGRFRIVRRTAE